MKKRITVALAAASLLLAIAACAQGEAALPGARVDTSVTAVSTPSGAQTEAAQDGVEAEPEAQTVETPTPEPVEAVVAENPKDTLEITEEYRWFISKYKSIRGRTVRYYDDVYAYNHGEYSLTPFDSNVPEEYLTVDSSGTYAVAPIVLDITDAMRVALYGGDVGEVSMLYGQYCERQGDGRGRTGFTGVHEGIDFTCEPGAALFAILPGEVTRAGDSNGTVAIYNAEYDVTVLYLHCEEIEVRRGDVVEAGAYIAEEGKKGSGGTYTHVEMRTGRHTTSNPYRNTILESDCPYPVMQAALGVVESGRQPVTAAAVMEAQRMREEAEAAARAEAEAAQKAAEEPPIELIDTLGTDEGYGFAEPTVTPEPTLPPAAE